MEGKFEVLDGRAVMHEMAIAEGILDIAREHAARENSARITKIGLLIGEMAGVEEDALRFCFSSLVNGTLAQDAELSIKRVPLVGRCGGCGHRAYGDIYEKERRLKIILTARFTAWPGVHPVWG